MSEFFRHFLFLPASRTYVLLYPANMHSLSRLRVYFWRRLVLRLLVAPLLEFAVAYRSSLVARQAGHKTSLHSIDAFRASSSGASYPFLPMSQ